MYMCIAFVDYVFASLVAQMENNPAAMQKTLFQSLGWDNSLEDSMETHSSILTRRIPMDRGAWQLQSMGLQRIRHDWVTKHTAH